MIHVTTASGFQCDIDEAAMDDMELLDDLVEMDKGGTEAIKAMSRVSVRLLGKEGKTALYDHLRDESGRVKMEVFAPEIKSIFEGLNRKN